MKYLYKKRVLLSFICLLFVVSEVDAFSRFASRSSQLRIAGNAQFNVSSPTVSINKGGLSFDPSAIITGQALFFEGILDQGVGGAELEVKGRFDPSAGSFGTIFLDSGHSVISTRGGKVRSNIVINGQNNRLQGSMSFGGDITLANVSSQVTLDLDSPLNKTIQTPSNGGRIDLARNTVFLDRVDLIQGDIAFNGNRLSLGGKTDSFRKQTRFLRGADLVLNGKAELDGGTWIFVDESVLNANGNLIDLKNGGTFSLNTGTTLELTNAVVRNIEQDSLIFTDTSSAIELSSVVLEVSTTLTMTTGVVSVVGQSTMIIKDGTWTVTNDAKMKVDGVSVIVDTSVNPNPNALVADVEFTNNGAVHYLFIDSITYLFNVVHTSTLLTLTTSFHMPSEERIVFGANTILDGSGGGIIFAIPDHAQLVVLEDSLVSFRNISLENITDKTFDIHPSSTVILGENTNLVFSSDITFSQGHILFDAPGQSVKIEGDHFNIVELRSINNTPGPLFDLGTATLVLENISLVGVENITYGVTFIDNELITGAISLAGNTFVDVDADLDMRFVIEKLNNYIRLRRSGLRLSGGISYSPVGENELIMTFLDPTIDTPSPNVIFSDNYFYLASELGRAHLHIDAYGAIIFNEGSNSFLLDIGGILDGNNLVINNFPIKLLSSLVDIGVNLNVSSDQPNAIEPNFIRSITRDVEFVEAFGLDMLNTDILDDEETRAPKNIKRNRAIQPPINPIVVTNTIQLSDARGEYRLESGEIKKFGISAIDNFNITLKNGATLDLNVGSEVVLKENDIINIVGTGNVIKVNADFIVEGRILFDDDSNLTIIFENNSILFLYRDLVLEPGIELSCQGDGQVLLGDDVHIFLVESAISYRQTELAFENKATLGVLAGGQATIRGKGLVSCFNTGGIVLNSASTLAIGFDKTDNIDLLVKDGQIRLDIPDAAPNEFARLSFGYGKYRIKGTLHGSVSIGNHGVFEVNVRNGIYVGGLLESSLLNLGFLFFIDPDGRMVLGENNILKPEKIPSKVLVDTSSSFFRGTGLVDFVTKSGATSFQACLGSVDESLYINKKSLSILDWVYRLVQQSSILKFALLFKKADGSLAIRTQLGAIITLGPDDEIIFERSSGRIVVRNHENDDIRTYNLNGTLV